MPIADRWIRAILVCTLLVAAVGYPRLSSAAEQKVALVIGNSAYPSSRLRNPVNDANAMATKLRAMGFDVILRTDVNLRDMTRSFSQFGQKLTPGSVGLFYYAGHGMQVQGKNFLIPVDAEIETEASVRTEAVDVDQLLHQLGPARLSMVILDACRNNPFERRFRGAGGGLAQIDAPTGTLLAYATAPGKVASDGTGSNGLYTEALLKALNMPGLKVEDVFKQVRINVIKASDGQQTPWESSSLTGEFYFTPDNKAAMADEKLKQAEKERADLAKALEEERKKRDKDTELIRVEMEKLRAELTKIRAAAAAAQPAMGTVPAETSKTASVASQPKPQPEQKPTQVAIASRAPGPTAPPAPVSVSPVAAGSEAAAGPAKPTTDTHTGRTPTQVAAIPPQPSPAAPPPPAEVIVKPKPPAGSPAPTKPASVAQWAESIALVEKFSGQLTYSKAMALLLGVKTDEELELLVKYDALLRRVPFQSAMALGVNARGHVTWSARWREAKLVYATEPALESCNKQNAEGSCRLVMVNGEFQEKEFIDVAKRLGRQTPDLVRQALVKATAMDLERQRGRW
jgi:uncharacterized caspase-like protein